MISNYIYTGESNDDYQTGQVYLIESRNMTGKIYKDLNDKEGVKDERIMYWKKSFNAKEPAAMKVYQSHEDFLKYFQPQV